MASPEDYMCPNCVTPWKCNGPHIPDPGPWLLDEALIRMRERGFSFYQVPDPCTDPTGTNELDAADFAEELRDALNASATPAPDVLTRDELVEALRREIHIDPEHGFPEEFGPEQLANNLFDAIRSRGGHHAKTQTS